MKSVMTIKLLQQTKQMLYESPVKPEDVSVPPFLPNTPEVRKDIARAYNNIYILDVEVKEIEGEEDMSDVPSGKWEGEPPSDKQVGILEEKIKDAIDAGKDELAAKAKAFLNSGEATKKNIFDWINTDGDWSLKDGS